MDKHLHIVSFDVPFPADYGGAIDVFYRLKALHQLGYKITLHCFHNKRTPVDELNKYAHKVLYYARNPVIKSIKLPLPYIVSSRANKTLVKNLLADDHPILFEGIHSAYPLLLPAFKNRKVAVRQFNAEYVYYKMLAVEEPSKLKRIYFNLESHLLKSFEKKIAKSFSIIAITGTDEKIFREEFKAKQVALVPAFIPNTRVDIKPGKGSYVLYQGNLSVNENENAAAWLATNVFSKIDVRFIVAGKNPSTKLQQLLSRCKDILLVVNPDFEQMQTLLQNAQIHLVPSFNKTGIKLKLLNALFGGRHCIANLAATGDDENIQQNCTLAETAEDYVSQIKKLMQIPFAPADVEQREALLDNHFNNLENAKKIVALLH